MKLKPLLETLKNDLYYFAFGLNMDVPLFLKGYKDAQPIKVAYLKDYTIAFNKERSSTGDVVSDVIKKTDSKVFGMLYKLPTKYEKFLDVQEGGYGREYGQVVDEHGNIYQVFFYVVEDKLPENHLPKPWYIGVMAKALKDGHALHDFSGTEQYDDLVQYIRLLYKIYKISLKKYPDETEVPHTGYHPDL